LTRHVEKIHQQIREMAESSFGGHEIRPEGGDVVRSWLCRNPKSSFYWFRVITGPRLVMVTGDIGDMVLHPQAPDSLAWARGGLGSPGYVFEKLETKLTEFDEGLIKSGLDELERDLSAGLVDGDELVDDAVEAFRELRDSHFHSAQAFYEDFRDSCLYADQDSIPCVERYSDSFYWRLEALRWFVSNLR